MKNKQKEWHTATKPLILHPGEEGGFVAYYCANATNRVNTCSVLEPARMIFGEIVQIKSERMVPVYRCN
jgi:hypothetical protein